MQSKNLVISTNNISEKIQNFRFSGFIKRNSKIFLLLTLLVAICYGNSLFNDFVSDDWGIFKVRHDFKTIFPNLTSLFSNYPLQIYRALLINTKLVSPILFRLPNLFAHLGSVYLVFIIITILSNKRTAIFAGVLFAVHPLLIESVTWISGGSYSQYSFFFLLSFFLYLLSTNNKKSYFISILSFYLALLFNEKSIPLFLIFPLYELCFGNFRKNWRKSLPFLLLSFTRLFLLLPTISTRQETLLLEYNQEKTINNPLIQIPFAITSYFELLFFPDKLTFYHSELSISNAEYVLRLLVFLTYLILLIWTFFKEKFLFFWLSFFLISLLITLNPVALGWVVAERYVYLGSIGIFCVVGYIIYKLYLNKKIQTIMLFTFLTITMLLCFRTIIRNFDWKNEDSLWLATNRVSPHSAQNHNNLGDYYGRHGDLSKAITEFQVAIRLKPNYADAYHNLGNVYFLLKKYPEAIKSYQKALSLKPQLWQSSLRLAGIYYDQKDYQQALTFAKEAYKINPDSKIEENIKLIKNALK